MQRPQAGADPTQKSAKPAQPAAAQQEREKRRVVPEFDGPDDLCAGEPAEHTDEGGIDAARRQAAAHELAMKDPQSGQRGKSDKRAEGRDFEITELKQYRVHDPVRRRSASPAQMPDERGERLAADVMFDAFCVGFRDRASGTPSAMRNRTTSLVAVA